MSHTNDDDIDALLDEIEAEQAGTVAPPTLAGSPLAGAASSLAPIDFSPMSPDEARQATDALRREAVQRAAAAATKISSGANQVAAKVTGVLGGLTKRRAEPPTPLMPLVLTTEELSQHTIVFGETATAMTSAVSTPAASSDEFETVDGGAQPIVSTSFSQEAMDAFDDASLTVQPDQAEKASDVEVYSADQSQTQAPAKRIMSPMIIGGVVGVLILVGGAGLWMTHSYSAPVPKAVATHVAPAAVKPIAPVAQAAPEPSVAPSATTQAPTSAVASSPTAVPVPATAPDPAPVATPSPAAAVAVPASTPPLAVSVHQAAPIHRPSTSGPKVAKQPHASGWQDKADSAMDAYLKAQH